MEKDAVVEEWKRYLESDEFLHNPECGSLLIARHFTEWQKERMMKDAAGKTCCGCAKQKWEYCEKVYSNRGPMNEFEKTQMNYSFPIFREDNLNEMGMEGWEAIHINEGKWTTKVMFKRLKIEENGED